MAKIESVDVTALRVPLDTPVWAPGLEIKYRDYILVDVICADGSQGLGFSYVGTGGGRAAALAAEELLVPHVLGRDANSIEDIWNRMYRATLIQGRAGIIMNGLSAVDIALWDRNARVRNLPLYKFLGGTNDGPIPAYASGGYYATNKSATDLGSEVASYVEQGFQAVKIKTGMLSVKDEEARVRAARNALGDERLLMLDIYNSWSNQAEAVRYLDMYSEFDPYWIEDPFAPDEIDAFAALAKRLSTPLATGEFHYTRWAFKKILDSGAAVIIQAEAPRCGGISEWKHIAALASTFGAAMSPCWFHDLHAHLMAGASNGLFVEYFPDFSVLNFGKLIDRQLTVEDGAIRLSEAPGVGFSIPPSVRAQYQI